MEFLRRGGTGDGRDLLGEWRTYGAFQLQRFQVSDMVGLELYGPGVEGGEEGFGEGYFGHCFEREMNQTEIFFLSSGC